MTPRTLTIVFGLFLLGAGSMIPAEAKASSPRGDAGSGRTTREMRAAPAGDWSLVDSPNAPAAKTVGAFNGVACVSTSDCWAVGYGNNGSAYQSLIEHWNGASWSIVSSPNTSGTQFNTLHDVTCVSAADCWAVGYSSTGSAYETLIQRWDGTSWSIVDSPNASTTDVLHDVTCVSASDCWAVGYSYSSVTGASQTLIEHWTGTAWTIVASANTAATEGNSLAGVTCVLASDCWAVGSAPAGTLIQRWNGNSWSIVTSPNRSGYGNSLSNVTCVSASDCWAVGASSNGNDWRTLIERWDGASWEIVSSPNKSALQMNMLADVTCVSASNCWAVGGSYDGGTWQTVTQRWDGASWTLVSSPSMGGVQNILSSVACLHATACRAAGSAWGNAINQTLSAQWDGTSWGLVASPNTTGYNTNVLADLTCVSSSDCWAVGSYHPDAYGPSQTLIEHWDGASWTVVASPNAGTRANRLVDVTCVSASDCWAVGYYYGESAAQTLVMRWDGTSPSPAWSIVPSANGPLDSFLSGVACASASDCWAVGTTYAGSPSRTLIEHWDGTEWALVASPNPGSSDPGARQRNELSAVTCVSASDCWAVGSYDADYATQTASTRPKTSRTLIARWNGAVWSVVASPDTPPIEQQFLSGVTCASASDCWAVGYSGHSVIAQTFVGQYEAAGTPSQTLVKHWDGTSWAVVPSQNSNATEANVLSDVACRSSSACWAVGSTDPDTASQTMIQRWDGGSWTTVASPNASVRDSLLSGVTCAQSDCWAVGNSHNGIVGETLVATSYATT